MVLMARICLPSWTMTKFHDAAPGAVRVPVQSDATVYVPVVFDKNGVLYSTTAFGGANGFGTVYKIDAKGNESVVRMERIQIGWWWTAAETFIGSRGCGGDLTCTVSSGCGLVYKIHSSGNYSVLHVFVGPDGQNPVGVLPDAAGNLYGVTAAGGAHNVGTAFKLTPSGQLTTLYTFTGGADGGQPHAGLIRDAAGNLYGTALAVGIVNSACFDFGCGVAFELSPAAGTWKETVLHSFNGNDGYGPEAPLTMDAAGSLYGTTSTGGDFSCTTIAAGSSCGVVFKISR